MLEGGYCGGVGNAAGLDGAEHIEGLFGCDGADAYLSGGVDAEALCACGGEAERVGGDVIESVIGVGGEADRGQCGGAGLCAQGQQRVNGGVGDGHAVGAAGDEAELVGAYAVKAGVGIAGERDGGFRNGAVLTAPGEGGLDGDGGVDGQFIDADGG